jgi:hypothetical protein
VFFDSHINIDLKLYQFSIFDPFDHIPKLLRLDKIGEEIKAIFQKKTLQTFESRV